MKTRIFAAVLIADMLAMPAAAHENGVYESLGHIPIGRIFLSPDERARLDKTRGEGPTRPAPVGSTPARADNKDAAGFIVSDSGITRIWKDGDFVATASSGDMRFPGHVRVTSQAAPRDNDDTAEADEDAERAVGTEDEQE